jgi:hypothetical protein
MTDWTALANALALNIPEADLARAVGPVAALEPLFRPLAATLTSDVEPAVVFEPAPEDPA